MIKLNEEFYFERDYYQWKLHHWRMGKDKNGNEKRQKYTTYYANLSNVCAAVVDRMAGSCNSMAELRDMLATAQNLLTHHVEELVERSQEQP